MIAEQGQFEGSDWLSAVCGRGLALVSDAIRWTATEDSLWSFSTLGPNLSTVNDTGVPVIIVAQWQGQHKQTTIITAVLSLLIRRGSG